MSEHKTLCMGCMEESDSFEICPKCGYVNSSANPASYLQPRTVLDSRYVVGRLLRLCISAMTILKGPRYL